ncbi:MAG: TetR/AcrR family transcriptional regulator [Deltaproteobacteria bacterium]|nr:TetR/AcrR family transcriptional regulator [Deltaproteobacteria bacterium]
MPKLVDRDAQRRQILAAARAVFAEHGLEGTGLTHVAEAAGMGRSSLYHYYPDQAALVQDLLRDLLAEEEALFRAALEGEGTSSQRLEGFLRAQLGYFDAWCQLAPLVFDLRARHTRQLRPFFRRIRATLGRLIEEGRARGEFASDLDPELAAAVAIGAIDGLLLQHHVDRGAFGDCRALADTLVHQVLRGLVP